jgi:hypothetical protein
MRRLVRLLPAPPRCKICNVPFAGPGKIFKLAGLGPARLQAAAQLGQLVVSERVYEAVQERFEHAVPVDLELKGKAAPVSAWIIAARSMKETAGTAV